MANNACIINPATNRAVKADGRTGKRIIRNKMAVANRMAGLSSRMASANRAETRALYAGAKAIATPPPKKKRGRPKGSKNKPK